MPNALFCAVKVRFSSVWPTLKSLHRHRVSAILRALSGSVTPDSCSKSSLSTSMEPAAQSVPSEAVLWWATEMRLQAVLGGADLQMRDVRRNAWLTVLERQATSSADPSRDHPHLALPSMFDTGREIARALAQHVQLTGVASFCFISFLCCTGG